MEYKNSLENSSITQPVDVTKYKKTSLLFTNIKKFLAKRPPKRRLAIVSGASLGLLVAGVGYIFFLAPKPAEPKPVPVMISSYVPPAPTTALSPLTGLEVEIPLTLRPVTGIMIENSIDARPQSGLVEAGVVFEAIAEGGITRFLALYQEAKPENIGPIRSARPYYVRWAAGFDAAYVHSGGSGEALGLIAELGVRDLDHANYDDYFTRVSNRYAPHNVYTDMSRLDELKNSKDYTSSSFSGFKRINLKEEEEKPVASPDSVAKKANVVEFDISGPLYNTRFNYDTESKTYKRTMAGQPHVDERSGKQISPSVVVALITDYSIHPDGVHSSYSNIGNGKIIVFQNGQVLEGTWEKPSDKASLSFKDSSGKDMLLQPGQTWITVIEEGEVTFSE